jgi:probable pyridine nucleotide-disulfide oxidoreductase
MRNSDVEDVDPLVVGGGKAGKSLAMDRAEAGWKLTMGGAGQDWWYVHQRWPGIPTRALVGSTRTLVTARGAAEMGVDEAGPGHDRMRCQEKPQCEPTRRGTPAGAAW